MQSKISLFLNKVTVDDGIGVAGGPKGPCLPLKFLEHIVILCIEKRFSQQNSVIRLKSNILAPQILGLATPLDDGRAVTKINDISSAAAARGKINL